MSFYCSSRVEFPLNQCALFVLGNSLAAAQSPSPAAVRPATRVAHPLPLPGSCSPWGFSTDAAVRCRLVRGRRVTPHLLAALFAMCSPWRPAVAKPRRPRDPELRHERPEGLVAASSWQAHLWVEENRPRQTQTTSGVLGKLGLE